MVSGVLQEPSGVEVLASMALLGIVVATGQPPALLVAFAAAGGHDALFIPLRAAITSSEMLRNSSQMLLQRAPPVRGPLRAAALTPRAAACAAQAYDSLFDTAAGAAALRAGHAAAQAMGHALACAGALATAVAEVVAAGAPEGLMLAAMGAHAVFLRSAQTLMLAAAASGDAAPVRAAARALAAARAMSVEQCERLALEAAVQHGHAGLVAQLFNARGERRQLQQPAPVAYTACAFTPPVKSS